DRSKMNKDGRDNSDRRRFLRWVIGGSAAIMAALTALPGIGYMLAPAIARGQRKRRRVVFKKPTDAASRTYAEARWERQEETSPGLFVRKDGDHYIVIWARCPHASCAV